MASLTGTMLGKYQVFERIGRGGMADVYKGRHTRLDREVAIKVLHSHLAEGEDFMARFEREARAIASLQHPNIVQVYDFDIEGDQVYMVMEHIGGGNLKIRLQEAFQDKRYLPLDFVQQILEQIGDGLDHAHTQDMLHRDVKPANVLMHEDGRAVLADFGIARIMSNTEFTATGNLIGTPAYMSPEQGRGETLTVASDLYSLGIILHEMLTNDVPFDAETPLGVIHKQIHDPLPPLEEHRNDLPDPVVRVVEQALAKVTEERFETARALSEAFRIGSEMVSAAVDEGEDELQPTVVMEATSVAEDLESTVVMEEPETLDETEVMVEEQTVSDVEEEGEGKPEAVSKVEAAPISPATRDVVESSKSLRRYLPYVLGGLVIVALIIVGSLSGWFSGGSPKCGNVEQCLQFSEDAMQTDDFAGAILLLEGAIDQIPADQQPPFADLWCRRADALLELDRVDEAIQSFETCAGWTHDDPEFQELREEVNRRIEALIGG